MEVIQLVRVAVEQIVAFPMPQIMGIREVHAACDADSGLMPHIMEETMEVLSWGSDDFSMSPDPQLLVIEGWEG